MQNITVNISKMVTDTANITIKYEVAYPLERRDAKFIGLLVT